MVRVRINWMWGTSSAIPAVARVLPNQWRCAMAATVSLLLTAAVSSALHVAMTEPNWPGARSSLKSLADTAACVLVGVATGKAEVHDRSGAHLSTATSLGDGTVIRGGGIITYAHCRQKFQVLDILRGEGEAGGRVLEYTIVEKAVGFPLPAPEGMIPDRAKVILVLDAKGNVLKALRDTADNRKAVREAFPRQDEPKK
jgi:hypothetical protein